MKRFSCLLVLLVFAMIPIAAMCEEEYSEEEMVEGDSPKVDEMPKIVSQPKDLKSQAVESQTREISEATKEKVQSKDGKAPEKEGDYYRFFGDKISLRANDKFIYIKAGETTIVADAQGQVQIKAAGDLALTSSGSVNISSGKDINLKAKGRVVTEGGGAKEGSLP